VWNILKKLKQRAKIFLVWMLSNGSIIKSPEDILGACPKI
jgi:hypothetical protein